MAENGAQTPSGNQLLIRQDFVLVNRKPIVALNLGSYYCLVLQFLLNCEYN